jgi:type IV secretory pathway VirB4 component
MRRSCAFIDRTDRVLALLDGFMPECRWLDDSETLTYLHSTVSTKRHRVRVPETPIYLDALLADQPLTGGLEPRLGDQHLRVLTIIGFPTATTPGLLDDLNRLAFPYRWSTRAILLDKTDATKLLTKIRRQWFAKRKSDRRDPQRGDDQRGVRAGRYRRRQQGGRRRHGLAGARRRLCRHGLCHRDDRGMGRRSAHCRREAAAGREGHPGPRLHGHGRDGQRGRCLARQLPGHAYANVRQPPISTLNLAHMIPLSAVWAGPERDEHFGAPPLLYGKTEGSTPFRFSLHVGDVGHTLVVGPTGAGKSVLLALMALQFRRYAAAQVFAFDFGGSIRAAALAMGGDWHDLGGGLTEGVDASVSLQPLARIHDTYERAWAADWIVAILMREGIAITPEVKEHLWTALTSLASAPVEERTITGLTVLLQSNDLKQALRPYCVGGPYGRLLDAEAEHLGSAGAGVRDRGAGRHRRGARRPRLSLPSHRRPARRLGRRCSSSTRAGLRSTTKAFSGQLREWLKTLRKKNASVIFATQSLSDIDNSNIAPAIIESCPTRLLLPNERAIEPQITAIYRRFGLNDRQIEILARATPKRDYYCQSRRGNRLFELGLSEVGLALCAASSKSDQTEIAQPSPNMAARAFSPRGCAPATPAGPRPHP